MNSLRIVWLTLVGMILITGANGQDTTFLRMIDGVDSTFIRAFARKNDFRGNYISQRYLLEFGSKRNPGDASGGQYSNVSELAGFGFTYKFIDLDLAFSLPQSRVLQADLQNLNQFRITGSFSGKRWTIRGYWLESTGMVVSDAEGQFVSSPSINILNIGFQYTYYFNAAKYSFRAATVQDEIQLRSAGSFLLRLEPFYRKLGVTQQIVPPAQDVPAIYGEQAGLEYAYAPGLVVQPGYGFNWTTSNGKWFVSPMIFAGGGIAFNEFKGSAGEKSSVNAELKGSATLNIGYNGLRMYATLRSMYEIDYFLLDPSYFQTTDLKLGLSIGYRFNHLEKALPESLF